MNTKKTSLLALLILVLLFLGVTVLADNALRSARIDLTQNSLFTLSQGTKRILKKLDEPIRFTLFFSDSLAAGRPTLEAYGKRVRELLEEYELRAGGTIELVVLDPEPFSEAEDQARRAGVAGVPVGQGEQFYFGLVGTNSTDGREVIPFFDQGQERFLEYELTRMIHKLSTSERPVLGLLTELPLRGQRAQRGMPPQATQPWAIMREIETLFDVVEIPIIATQIPDGIDLLLIVHWKQQSEDLLLAIDEYIIDGGAAVICVDPLCDADIPPGAMQNPSALMQADRSSEFNALLERWGVTMDPEQIVVDLEHALRGPARGGRDVVSYVQFLGLGKDQVDASDAVTGGLSRLHMATVGALRHDEAKGTTWTPLVWSGADSAEIAAARLAFFPDPQELVAGFVPSGGERVIAGRLGGSARSAFTAPDPADGEKESETALPDQAGELNVLVVSDCDFLADRWWMQEMRMGNMVLGLQKTSDNGDFFINALDNMAGSSDLISLRARGEFSRPFTLVQRIQRDAETQYLAEAQELEENRRQTQQRIRELQQSRPDAGELILTPEQKAEIATFREELADTNTQLREVRFKLRKDVEDLGTTLKIVNTALAPALVALGAVGLGAYRVVRRRADRRVMAGQG